MGSLAISNKSLDKYIRSLSKLDTNSKKKLIIKLTESIESKVIGSFDLKSIYGAWEDSRDSDEIIKEIKEFERISDIKIENWIDRK